MKDPAAIELLISALNDDNQDLRSAAALAPGQTGADKGVEPLAKMLQSQRLRDRWSAIIALGTIGGGKACEALIPLLKAPSAEDRDSVVAADHHQRGRAGGPDVRPLKQLFRLS